MAADVCLLSRKITYYSSKVKLEAASFIWCFCYFQCAFKFYSRCSFIQCLILAFLNHSIIGQYLWRSNRQAPFPYHACCFPLQLLLGDLRSGNLWWKPMCPIKAQFPSLWSIVIHSKSRPVFTYWLRYICPTSGGSLLKWAYRKNSLTQL